MVGVPVLNRSTKSEVACTTDASSPRKSMFRTGLGPGAGRHLRTATMSQGFSGLERNGFRSGVEIRSK